MTCDPVPILGSGMAALGAASRLAAEAWVAVLYDANPYPGGDTATFDAGGGFLFDDGPHVSFTKDQRIRDLLADNVDGAFEEVKAYINNYWHRSWIPHPVQMHLHGLPTELVIKIVRDFVGVHATQQPAVTDYEQWLRAAYGDTFAESAVRPAAASAPMIQLTFWSTRSAEKSATASNASARQRHLEITRRPASCAMLTGKAGPCGMRNRTG